MGSYFSDLNCLAFGKSYDGRTSSIRSLDHSFVGVYAEKRVKTPDYEALEAEAEDALEFLTNIVKTYDFPLQPVTRKVYEFDKPHHEINNLGRALASGQSVDIALEEAGEQIALIKALLFNDQSTLRELSLDIGWDPLQALYTACRLSKLNSDDKADEKEQSSEEENAPIMQRDEYKSSDTVTSLSSLTEPSFMEPNPTAVNNSILFLLDRMSTSPPASPCDARYGKLSDPLISWSTLKHFEQLPDCKGLKSPRSQAQVMRLKEMEEILASMDDNRALNFATRISKLLSKFHDIDYQVIEEEDEDGEYEITYFDSDDEIDSNQEFVKTFPKPCERRPAYVTKVGWLTRQTKRKTWKKRYYVLENLALLYFSKPTKTEPKGVIPLEGATLRPVQMLADMFCFEISNRDRVLHVIAVDVEEARNQWTDAINNNIHVLQESRKITRGIHVLRCSLKRAMKELKEQRTYVEIERLSRAQDDGTIWGAFGDHETIASLQTEIEHLKQQCDEEHIQKLREDYEFERRQSQDLTSEVARGKTQNRILAAECKRLRNELQAQRDEYSKLKSSRRKLARECKRLKQLIQTTAVPQSPKFSAQGQSIQQDRKTPKSQRKKHSTRESPSSRSGKVATTENMPPTSQAQEMSISPNSGNKWLSELVTRQDQNVVESAQKQLQELRFQREQMFGVYQRKGSEELLFSQEHETLENEKVTGSSTASASAMPNIEDLTVAILGVDKEDISLEERSASRTQVGVA